jgi:hypothetical protein
VVPADVRPLGQPVLPQTFTRGGASHWAGHESARTPGRSHVSVNVYPTYVDVPAALQSTVPIENMVTGGTDDQARLLAAMVERLYVSWKREEDFDLKCHKANITKALYGRTAAKVYWDDDLARPCIDVVDQPKNLYLGWSASDYLKLDWTLYCYQITPQTALEDWGLHIGTYDDDGKTYPYVINPALYNMLGGTWTANLVNAELRVEVYDYWYRRPVKNAKVRFGKPTKFETWNAVFVGNILVANVRHPEYDGKMPYVPLFNTFIPGVADGRPELYDIEQLIREKDERISENAQMIDRAVQGQMWQLTGAEAPNQVPSGLRPTPNNVVAPGPGNRLEPITPWMPEFQLENFLSRLDRELNDVSGLNDLLRGMAPQQVLNSGKAIAALTANYEVRMSMKRDLYYVWRRAVWELAATVWSKKSTQLRPILTDARTHLELKAPSLTPRDDLETLNMAGQAKEMKLWSMRRSMDAVGVDDPETELDMIREEQTDATLNPAAVQVMVTLMATMQQLQMSMQQMQQMAQQQQPGAGGPGQPTPEQGADAMRQLGSGPQGSPELNAPEEQPATPTEQLPANAAGAAGAGPGSPGGPSQLLSQFQVQNGEATGRIIGQQTIQKSGK